MKKIRWFALHYRLFVGALLGLIAALGFTFTGQDEAAKWLLIGIIAAELIPLLWGMLQDLRIGKYGIDILAATAVVTSLIMGEYWAGLVIILMLTGGQALEDYAGHRAENELEALLKRAPVKARILRGRKEVEIQASDVQVGDKIIIRAGDTVPVDAIILEGSANFDESSLTGESLPQGKTEGQDVLSGSVNLDGSVIARAQHAAADSQYQQIIKLVRSARHSQAPFVRLADRYAVPFTLLSFAIAATAWIVSGDSARFLEVLVVATPCPLILAAPIAIISGMSRSAKHGIIIKTGGALERLAATKTFAFDKTGTLTRGKPVVAHVENFKGFTKTEVLAFAAGLEQHSNHALAAAIVDEAKNKHTKLVKTKYVRELAGKGLIAQVGGRHILVGGLSFMREHNIALPTTFKSNSLQKSAAFVAIDGNAAGVITFTDEVREEAKTTLKVLKKLGITRFMMVTGDNKSTAATIGRKLGITNVHAEALPGDKLLAIESITERPVAFVGDGVNDAPVLTASDVGIALGARGSAAASESADVVVMLDDLSRVGRAVAIAKHTFHIARQSILIGIGLSVGLMLVYATGRFSALSGALIQELVDIVVIINALRAHGGKKE